MVGKLAPNLSHLTRGLVKSVPGRGFFRAVPSENGEKYVTYPTPPQSLNLSTSNIPGSPGVDLGPRKDGEPVGNEEFPKYRALVGSLL